MITVQEVINELHKNSPKYFTEFDFGRTIYQGEKITSTSPELFAEMAISQLPNLSINPSHTEELLAAVFLTCHYTYLGYLADIIANNPVHFTMEDPFEKADLQTGKIKNVNYIINDSTSSHSDPKFWPMNYKFLVYCYYSAKQEYALLSISTASEYTNKCIIRGLKKYVYDYVDDNKQIQDIVNFYNHDVILNSKDDFRIFVGLVEHISDFGKPKNLLVGQGVTVSDLLKGDFNTSTRNLVIRDYEGYNSIKVLNGKIPLRDIPIFVD